MDYIGRLTKVLESLEVDKNGISITPMLRDSIVKGLREEVSKDDYNIGCVAMAIVNHTNEINKVDVDTRRANNDRCFDYAEGKIRELMQ